MENRSPPIQYMYLIFYFRKFCVEINFKFFLKKKLDK